MRTPISNIDTDHTDRLVDIQVQRLDFVEASITIDARTEDGSRYLFTAGSLAFDADNGIALIRSTGVDPQDPLRMSQPETFRLIVDS